MKLIRNIYNNIILKITKCIIKRIIKNKTFKFDGPIEIKTIDSNITVKIDNPIELKTLDNTNIEIVDTEVVK